jgi:F-type H+-transporting ATPase subunit a
VSSRVRNITIGVVALVIAIASIVVFPTGDPHVEVKAEPIFYITPTFPFTNALLVTIIVDVFLIVLAFFATRNMQLAPRGLQNMVEAIIEALYNLFKGVNPAYVGRAFPLLATIFLFLLFSNWFGLLPGFGSIGVCEHKAEEHSMALAMDQGVMPAAQSLKAAEGGENYTTCPDGTVLVPIFRSPSADLNNTFAIAFIAWVFFQYWGFRALGPGYLSKFFNIKGIMSFVGIIEFISELVKLPALAFRLFGNIFAGEVLLLVMAFLIPLFLPLPFYIFEVFVGFIQAFIFAILTMAFLNIAVSPHDDSH